MKWDPSVNAARKAGIKDGKLTHEEVVEIIRSALDYGGITELERKNLQAISKHSKIIPDRSRRLLELLCSEHSNLKGDTQKKKLKVASKAANKICDFLKLEGNGVFPKLDRDVVGVELLMRISEPGIIAQKASSLCGPAALLYSIASHRPLRYVEFATDLYDKGRGRIGELVITPGTETRQYDPKNSATKKTGPIAAADWLTLASIRDSENWFLDYEAASDKVAGITMPSSLAKWFIQAGFRDVKNVTNVVFTKGQNALDDVQNLLSKGYRVCLFVHKNMVVRGTEADWSPWPNHWIAVTKVISHKVDVKIQVFNHGKKKGRYQIPRSGKKLLAEDFFKNFYGYVAAKP